MNEADVVRVIETFEKEGARWALVGAYAVGLLTEPRATVDFDFVVEERKLKAVIRALTEAFGDLGQDDIGAAIRLKSIDVDLIRSNNHPLFREALDRAELSGDWRIPPPEVIIALKFMSAVNPWRNRDKRRLDMADLALVYDAVGPDAMDRTEMIRLASLAYPGAEQEFQSILLRLDRGDRIEI